MSFSKYSRKKLENMLASVTSSNMQFKCIMIMVRMFVFSFEIKEKNSTVKTKYSQTDIIQCSILQRTVVVRLAFPWQCNWIPYYCLFTDKFAHPSIKTNSFCVKSSSISWWKIHIQIVIWKWINSDKDMLRYIYIYIIYLLMMNFVST